MKKTSKYLGMRDGEWVCTHVGIACVQPAYVHKVGVEGKVRAKSPGHRQYFYAFERLTSDGKAMKMIQLNAQQANMVLNGRRTVEFYSQKKERENSRKFHKKVSYSFCD